MVAMYIAMRLAIYPKRFKTSYVYLDKGPFVNYVSILGYLVGQKRAIFAYF